MLEGRISKLDLARRSAVIVATDGREYTVSIPEEANIEVSELETVGTMGGTIEDLEVGFHVAFEAKDHQPDGSCTCINLESIS